MMQDQTPSGGGFTGRHMLAVMLGFFGVIIAVNVTMAVFAIFLAWTATAVVQDTVAYGSTAQTPWATPLIWPQSVWYVFLCVFALIALGYALRAGFLFFGGRIDELNEIFHPRSAKEELKEEIDDLQQRQQSLAVGPPGERT